MQKRQHLKDQELEGCLKLLYCHQESTEKVGRKTVSWGSAVMPLIGRRAVTRSLKQRAFQPQGSHRLRCGLDKWLVHKCL